MKKVYKLEKGYYTGFSLDIDDNSGVPFGFTLTPPLPTEEGEWAVFNGRSGVTTIPPVNTKVPASITMRQARLQLHAIGKLSKVQEEISKLPEPPRTEAQIEWDYASVVERGSKFVALLTPLLGLTEDEMDELFIQASTL